MKGLNGIFEEITNRRNLLHSFVNDRKICIPDGELFYKPTPDAESYQNLTAEDFNSQFREDFLKPQEWSRLTIRLKPDADIPSGYEINELLEYEFGGGYYRADILFELGYPNLEQSDRWLYLYVEHRKEPELPFKYMKGNQEWTYPGGFPIEDKELEGFLISTHPYTRWKQDVKKTRPRAKASKTRAECGGDGVCCTEEGYFTTSIILIDENTSNEKIWLQFLIHALSQGYFGDANGDGYEEAYSEIGGLLGMTGTDSSDSQSELLANLTEHFRKKRIFAPYVPQSTGAYLKQIMNGYRKKIMRKESGGLRGKRTSADVGKNDKAIAKLEGEDEDSPLIIDKGISRKSDQSGESHKESSSLEESFRYPPGSVPAVALETGILERTIYRYIQQGRIQADRETSKDGEEFLTLSSGAINELNEIKRKKEVRKLISKVAQDKGKSKEAVKKWLQRNRGLSEAEFNNKLCKWLGLNEEAYKAEARK